MELAYEFHCPNCRAGLLIAVRRFEALGKDDTVKCDGCKHVEPFARLLLSELSLKRAEEFLHKTLEESGLTHSDAR